MKKHKLKGTYRIIRNDTIEWKIQDDVTIMIFICATSSGEYPHSNIMELLRNYNDYKFEK